MKFFSGANPTIVSCNASVVKFYTAPKSTGRFYNINYFPYYKNALAYYGAGVVVNSKVVGLGPGKNYDQIDGQPKRETK
jgi:hypothetical protein